MKQCPEPSCDWSPTSEGETDDAICPIHHRYALPPITAVEFERAPFMGYAIQDRYVLDGFVGGGGMGSVYRAEDRRLKRHVAIKVLLPQLTATSTGRARFSREAQSLSRLKSTHSVTVHDSGVIATGPIAGVAYMIMELLEGETLEDRGRGRELAATEVAEILRQITRSLDEAHQMGIVHRDLKPGNILLTTEPDGQRLVKVIDFGIARIEGSDHTGTGAVMGTPFYMAPEQCKGERVDQRADVYALAVISYQLLAGTPPFTGKNPMAVMVAHMQAPAPTLPGAEHNAERTALNAVLQRGLAKSPDDRFPTVESFYRAFAQAADLGSKASGAAPKVATANTMDAFQQTGGQSMPPAAATTDLRPPPNNRLPLIIGVALVAITLGVTVAFFAQSPNAAPDTGVPEVVPVVVTAPDIDAAPAAPLPDDAQPSAPPPDADVARRPISLADRLRAELATALEEKACPAARSTLSELMEAKGVTTREFRRLKRGYDVACSPRKPKPVRKPRRDTPKIVVTPVPEKKTPDPPPKVVPSGKPGREL